MKKLSVMMFVASACFFASAAAMAAGPDAALTVSGPSSVEAGEMGTVTFTVSNQGNRDARSLVVTIALPSSGSLLAVPSGCSQQGSSLQCGISRLRPGQSRGYEVDWAFPTSAGSVDFSGVASVSRDTNAGNNNAALSVLVTTPPPPPVPTLLQDGEVLYGEACYGSAPLVFQDCIDHPSSILQGMIEINGNGTVNTYDPGYSGVWSQSSAHDLSMSFFLQPANTLVSSWTGAAFGADCYEGTIQAFNTTSSIHYGAFRFCRGGFPVH